MKKELSITELFFFEFFIRLFFFIICTCVGIFFTFLRGSILDYFNKSGHIIYILLILLFSGLALFIIISTIPFIKDFKSVKSKRYDCIEGEIIGFKQNLDADSGIQINSFVIIKGEDKIITLHVNQFLEKGKKYTFEYLRNTKIAKVKNS